LFLSHRQASIENTGTETGQTDYTASGSMAMEGHEEDIEEEL